MKQLKLRSLSLGLLAILMVILSACSPAAAEAVGAPTAVGADSETVVIYAPATPSSVPVLMATEQMGKAEVTIFTDHAQAHTLFLRGDVDILVTGLSIGIDFVRQDVPVQIVNSYVSGLTYLVTYDQEIESFADLQGREIMLPFEGSPIEEVTRYFVEAAGLTWGEDVVPIYAPFPATVEMLKTGEATVAALPEPFVSQAAGVPAVDVALSYEGVWNALTDSDTGYPQVGVFVRAPWAADHSEEIARFNQALEDAVTTVREAPGEALTVAESAMNFPLEILASALARTSLAPRTGSALEDEVRGYYELMGEPLDGTYERFFMER